MNIAWLDATDLPRFQQAVDAHWRRGHILARDEALVRWQYRNPRDPRRLSVLCATKDQQIVGALGLIQTDFNHRGRRERGFWLALWFAAAAAPVGTGLALLKEALQSNVEIVACLGFTDVAERMYRALKFEVIDAVPRWIRAISPEALRRVLAQCGQDNAATLAHLLDRASNSVLLTHSPSLRIVPWSAEHWTRWDEAWSTRFAGRLTCTWRDSEYLRWRYVEHPRYTYHGLFAQDSTDETIRGLLVYREERIQGQEDCVLRIVELLGEDAAASQLAAAAIERAQRANAAFVDFFCTLPETESVLSPWGFVLDDSLATSVPMLFQPLDARRARVRAAWWSGNRPSTDASSVTIGDSLYITRSDGDQDRPN